MNHFPPSSRLFSLTTLRYLRYLRHLPPPSPPPLPLTSLGVATSSLLSGSLFLAFALFAFALSLPHLCVLPLFVLRPPFLPLLTCWLPSHISPNVTVIVPYAVFSLWVLVVF
mmetsp:Transcript_7275/g.22401  ORF Transcript_7275/g.22401 Transcript_7275/m.22401 type:complete len:112 (+) Transcript_7275:402-737(+)